METKKRMTRKLDLLTAVEQVVELSKGSRLNAEFFKKAAHPLKHLSERLEMTKEQSVMMALFIDNSNDTSIRNSDFSRHLECSTTRVIRLMSDIEELERRGLVCCRRDGSDISYRVPWEVVEAFERRFLYKIKFNKPTLEARMQIWHTMLPDLNETDIQTLAERYDFSGGQIENIARHYAIDSILHSDSAASLEKLMEHCDSERLEQKESRKIGFK